MRKLLTILVLLINIHSFSQDVTGSRIIARQSFFLRNTWLDSLRRDTIGLAADYNSVMTSAAVYNFVNARMAGAAGPTRFGKFGEDNVIVEARLADFQSANRFDVINTTGIRLQALDVGAINNSIVIDLNGVATNANAYLTVNNSGPAETGWFSIHDGSSGTDPFTLIFSGQTIPTLGRNFTSDNWIRVKPREMLFRNHPSSVIKWAGVPTTTDTTWKALVFRASDSSMKVMTYWPEGGGGTLNPVTPFSVKFRSDTLLLDNEDVETADDQEVYGKFNGTKGFKRFQVINQNAGIQHNDLYRYDSTTTEIYSFHTNVMYQVLEFKARASGWISAGDSILIDSNLMDRKITLVSVDGVVYTEEPSSGNDKWYEHNSVTGQITFHPSPVNDSSVISIHHVWSAMYAKNVRRTAPLPLTWLKFDYNDNTNLSETDDVWTTGAGAGWDAGRGVSNDPGRFIAANTDGAIRFQYTGASVSDFAKFGLNASSSQVNAADFDYGVALVGNEIYRFSSNTNSSFTTGVTVSSGNLVALFRENGSVTVRKSTDGGINWTLVYTYVGTDNNALYPVSSFFWASGPSYDITDPRILQPQAVTWDGLIYNSADDLEELTADEWTVKGAASSPYTAVADAGLKLPAGTDGGYRIRYYTATAYDAIVGFDATTTNNSYGNYDYWAQCGSDGTIYVNENTTGSVNTGIQCADGDWLGIWRVGNQVTCQKSSDGVSWTMVYSYPTTTTVALYPKADCTFMGARKLIQPQTYNVQ